MKTIKYYPNDVINNWTIIKKAIGKFYVCRCKCGVEKEVSTKELYRKTQMGKVEGHCQACLPRQDGKNINRGYKPAGTPVLTKIQVDTLTSKYLFGTVARIIE